MRAARGRRQSVPERRGAAGFTLLEAVVVVAITAVALYLAAGLLHEVWALVAASSRRLNDPLSGVATSRLRADVHGSRWVLVSSPLGFTPAWTSEPLELVGYYPDTVIRYAKVGRELHRSLRDVGGQEVDRSVWLYRLVSFRWRRLGARLVDVEIVYWLAPEPSDYRLDGRPGSPADRLQRERLRLALRGAGAGVGW